MDLFLPSERNGSVPLLLSSTGISAYLAVALFLLLTPSYLRVSQLASLTAPTPFGSGDMVSLTNDARTEAGLPVLLSNQTLARAAEAKLADMFARQYFAHTAPDGTTPWSFVKGAGYTYTAAGENLAADFTRAEEAEAAFLASPTHRANIVNPLYREIGVAVGSGDLFGRPSVLIVEYFGAPKRVTAPASPSSSPRLTSTRAVGTIRITPASEPSRGVLGTSVSIPDYVKIKLFALLLITTLVVTSALLWIRSGSIPFDVAARTALAIAILLYAATIGVTPWSDSTLTPTAEATVVVVQ